ncbi:tetratricopeptide repeat protein [soil metagenome]
MRNTLFRRVFPVLALSVLVSAGPARAGYEDLVAEGSSLSGSYLAGRSAGKLRDMDIAAQYFQQALRDDPNNSVLIERVFVFELSEGNIPAAEDYAPRVLSFNSQHRLARIVLGLRDARLRHYDKAREHFRRAAYTPVGELTAALLTAWTYAAQGNQAKAFQALDGLDSNEALANFKAFHGALIADYIGAKLRARTFYVKANDQAGGSLRVTQAYGNYLERNGEKDEARKVYQSFLAGAEQNPLIRAALADLEAGRKPKPFISTPLQGIGESLFSLASALSDDQGLDVALAYIQLALSADAERDISLTLLGDIYENMNSYQRSANAYDMIGQGSLLRPNADIQIAINLQKLDKSAEAQARLKAVIAKNPRNADAIITLGNIYRNNEQYQEAAKTYDQALSLLAAPGKDDWSTFYYRGISNERNKQWDKAEADLREALKLSPEQPSVLNYLGYSMIEKRVNLPEAIGMVRRAVELKPNDGYIVDSLGWAHFQLGEFDEAVKQLERAVELKPADPVIADHLGDAYWRAGRKLEASFQWQHAKDNKPDADDLKRIEAKLRDGLPDEPPVKPAENKTEQNKG